MKAKYNKAGLMLCFSVLLILLFCSCDTKKPSQVVGNFEHYFSNMAQASYVAENSTHIYFANVYDQRRLYRYNKETYTHELVVENLIMCSHITATDESIYFSAWDVTTTKRDVRNIYKMNTEEDAEAKLVVKAALSPIVVGEKLYYLNDNAPRDLYEYDVNTGVSTALIQGHDCDTIIVDGNNLYTTSCGTSSVVKYDLKTNILEETFVEGGPYGLSLYHNALYFHTYYKGYIYQMDPASDEMLLISNYNDGEFWFLGAMATDDYIFFAGSELVNNKTTGGYLYRQNRSTKNVERIADFAADHFYILGDYIYVFREDETSLEGPSMKVLSLDGEEVYNKDVATYGLT